MQLTELDLLFWAAGFGIHLSLLFVLLVRSRFKTFPIFTTFVAANATRTIVLYVVQHHESKATYFYTFWSLAVTDTILQLCLVYEMYSSTFRPLGVWAQDVRHAFLWLISVSVFIAALLSWMAAPATRLWMQAVVIRGNLFSSVWISELLVGMISLSVTAGLPWNTHVARISIGLGLYSVLDVLVETAHSFYGVGRDIHVYTALSHIRMAAYLCTAAYWVVALWRNAPKSRTLSQELRMQLATLQRRVEYDLQRIRSGR